MVCFNVFYLEKGIKCGLLCLIMHTEGLHDQPSHDSSAVFWKIIQTVDSLTICTVGTIEQFHTLHSFCYEYALTINMADLSVPLLCK